MDVEECCTNFLTFSDRGYGDFTKEEFADALKMYNMNYGNDRDGNRSFPGAAWSQSQHPGSDRQASRVLVEISDDEDSLCQMPPLFHPSRSKGPSRVTPPLDLTVPDEIPKSSRQVESPLDLTVKTRKRCADTTDYDDLHGRHPGHLPEMPVTKRLCVGGQGQEYIVTHGAVPEQQRHNVQGHMGMDQKCQPMHHESVIRNKMIQNQMAAGKFMVQQRHPRRSPLAMSSPSLPVSQHQAAPMAAPQQHQYSSLQRQSVSQSRHMPMHKTPYPTGDRRSVSQSMATQQPRQQHHQQQQQPAFISTNIPKPLPSTNSETVALQGFFEPTQKVTVNTGSNIQLSKFSQNPPRVHQEQPIMQVTNPMTNTYPIESQRNNPNIADQNRQAALMHSAAFPPGMMSRPPRPQLSPMAAPSQMEMHHQQKQMQHQRQMHQTSHRHHRDVGIEKSDFIPQITPQTMIGTKAQLYTPQELRAAMYDASKSPDIHMSQLQCQSKQQLSPYTQQSNANFVTNAMSIPGRPEDLHYSQGRYIRAGQPVQLADINRHQATIEKNMLQSQQHHGQTHMPGNMPGRFVSSQSKIVQEVGQHDSNLVSTHGIRDESRFCRSDNSNIAYMERSNEMNRNMHPSVIQRPQGFIPPRIVSGSGRSTHPRQSGSSTYRMDASAEMVPHSSGSIRQKGDDRSKLASDVPYSDGMQYKRIQGNSSPRSPYIEKGSAHTLPTQDLNQRRIDERQFISDAYKKGLNVQSQANSGGKQRMDTPRRNSLSNRISLLPRKMSIDRDIPVTRESVKHSDVPRQMPNTRESITNAPLASLRGSITKGTSGIQKDNTEVDVFSKFVMNELKKTDEDDVVNPFANRSLLLEYDRSANSSPVRKQTDAKPEPSPSSTMSSASSGLGQKLDTFKNPLPSPIPARSESSSSLSSYTLPLEIAIPGSKVASGNNTTARQKLDSQPMKPSKIMSRKQMILSQFKIDQTIKHSSSVDIDQDQKLPVEIAKNKRPEKDTSVGCPPSPKMPILSPQERNRTTPLVSPALVNEPPNLDESLNSDQKSTKEINSLEEHLHRLISDAVKGSTNKDKESVYETVRRELTAQPQSHKVFLSRQLSQTRNIPVANVAPIIHEKTTSDVNASKTQEDKTSYELNEEDEKMAQEVTRSLLGRSKDFSGKYDTPDLQKPFSGRTNDNVIAFISDTEGSNSNMSFPNLPHDNMFDENSNSKRMSPGLKKLIIYRHREVSETSKDPADSEPSVCRESLSTSLKNVEHDVEKERNVFGAFDDILAQKCKPDEMEEFPCWSGINEKEQSCETVIQLVPNTDYDGDDELVGRHKVPRPRQQSNVRQQAERLIKKARHRKNIKGDSGRLLSGTSRRRGAHQKGFVDFMPQVLPRRTRSRSSGKAPHGRRNPRSGKTGLRQRRRSRSQETKRPGQIKGRQRRSSSLDRESRSGLCKAATNQNSYSDNELEHADHCERVCATVDNTSVGVSWNNNDESTDEEYFQNYEDEYKNFLRKSDSGLSLKKPATSQTRKKKGFHFQQKYIFQKKRRTKGRCKVFDTERSGTNLDELYIFNDEVPALPIPGNAIAPDSDIPIPPEVKRLSVNKDTGETLLHRAARMGHEEVILYCIVTGHVTVNARDNAGFTALHECAVRGRTQIAKHLLRHGADVNCCSVDGIRPIHDCVENDHLETLRLLLSYGADPTLSTYAGRSLMKIARTDRMKKYLQAYLSDLNGYSSPCDEKPWQFHATSTVLEPEDNYGCAIFSDLPSDPEDESRGVCHMSAKPLLLSRRLVAEPGRREEDFILVRDLLSNYKVSQADFDSYGFDCHIVKAIPSGTLKAIHEHSVYWEEFAALHDDGVLTAVRSVDSAQIVGKLEKERLSNVAGKRTKC